MPCSRALLRAAAILLLGQSIGALGLALRQGTVAGRMAHEHLGWRPDLVDGVGTGALLAASMALVLAAVRGRTPPAPGLVVAGTFAAGWMALPSWAELLWGRGPLAAVSPIAHAIRFALPALLAYAWWGGSARLVQGGLRWAAGLVFIGHGLECLLGHPTFLDFLVVVPARWMGWPLSPEVAVWVLPAIGVLDVVVGLLLPLRPRRGLALWMTFWGALTAAVRILYFGPMGWPDALVRVTNGGAPLLVLLFTSWGNEGRPRSPRLASPPR